MATKTAQPMDLAHAIERAQSAFTTYTTFCAHNWKLQQLFGLSRFLIHYQGDLFAILSQNINIGRSEYNQELGHVLNDIAQHYSSVAKQQEKRSSRRSVAGTRQQCLPVGVSMIVTHATNPLRIVFCSLAANISAGNTVILASTETQDSLVSFLQDKAGQYLDPEAILAVSGVDLDSDLIKQVDSVSIFGNHVDDYKSILWRPNVRFLHAFDTSSFVVVDEGPKAHKQIATDVLRSFASRAWKQEAVSTLFIHHADVDAFRKAFIDPSGKNAMPQLKDKAAESILAPFSPHAVYTELRKLLRHETPNFGIAEAMSAAKGAGALLVVSFQTLDQVIEGLKRLKRDPRYLTLLSPRSSDISDYFEKWTSSDFYSVGSIPSNLPYVCQSNLNGVDDVATQFVFSPALFAQKRLSMVVKTEQHKQPLEQLIRSTEAVVRRPREGPNQTMEFFGYMKNVAIGIVCTFGICSSSAIWYWYIRTR